MPLPLARSMTSRSGSRPRASSSSTGVSPPGTASGPSSESSIGVRELAVTAFFASALLSAICSRRLSVGFGGAGISALDFTGDEGAFKGEREPDFVGEREPAFEGEAAPVRLVGEAGGASRVDVDVDEDVGARRPMAPAGRVLVRVGMVLPEPMPEPIPAPLPELEPVRVGVPGAEVVEMVEVVRIRLDGLAVPDVPDVLLVVLILLVVPLPRDDGGGILDIACFVDRGGCEQRASEQAASQDETRNMKAVQIDGCPQPHRFQW
jgi:hypothetical protein